MSSGAVCPLAGEASYDSLESADQAVVRCEWEARTTKLLANLDLRSQLIADGRSWVELDDDDQVVRRTPANPG